MKKLSFPVSLASPRRHSYLRTKHLTDGCESQLRRTPFPRDHKRPILLPEKTKWRAGYFKGRPVASVCAAGRKKTSAVACDQMGRCSHPLASSGNGNCIAGTALLGRVIQGLRFPNEVIIRGASDGPSIRMSDAQCCQLTPVGLGLCIGNVFCNTETDL